MAGVVLSQGLTSLEGAASVLSWLQSLTLRLFINNHTPIVTDGNGAYTQATFPGYAGVPLTTWTATGIDGNHNYEFDHAAVGFTSTGTSTNTIYGYYLTDGAGNVVAAELAAASFSIAASGLTYTVTPSFYMGQLSGTP